MKKVYSKENDAWSLASEEYFVYDGYKQIAAYTGAARTLTRTYAWDAAGLDTPLWTTDYDCQSMTQWVRIGQVKEWCKRPACDDHLPNPG